MRLTGTLLEVENYSGTFDDDKTREKVPYSGQRLHVLDGREVVKVKVPKDLVDKHDLIEGEAVDLRITVTAQAGARSAYLTVVMVGEWVPAAYKIPETFPAKVPVPVGKTTS